MKLDYDVIAVGAGPGGSTAARFCAQAGLRTLLIEKERLPRYKACGGCLSVKAVRFLGFDLNPVIENIIYGARFTYCLRDPIFIDSKEPIAFMVMRDRFDQLLVKKAVEEGVEILEGERVEGVRESRDGIEVALERGGRFHCKYLIGADGPESVVAKSLSLLQPKKDGSGIGLESEIRFGAAIDFPKENLHIIQLDFGRVPNGYGWVFPKREGLSVGIGGIFQKKERVKPYQLFTDFIRELGFIDEEKVGRVVGHHLPCFYDERQKVSQGRVLLVGDAAYLMDPLTGEGVYHALQSGRLAAEAITQSRGDGAFPSDLYQDAIRDLIFGNLRSALHVSRIIYGFTKLSYRTLQQYPELGNLYLQVLEGKTTYQSFVVRVKEQMKNLLKGRFSAKIRETLGRI